MSEGKRDRTTAPRIGTRPSRAKETRDRNITPPAVLRPRAPKPKKGERVMQEQLAARESADATKEPAEVSEQQKLIDRARVVATERGDDDEAPPPDPWWTVEREAAFQMALSGAAPGVIAAELKRERHTIYRWMEDKRFTDRMYEENTGRFHAMRQRRTMQTVRLTDKAEQLATKMMGRAIELAGKNQDDLPTRLAARDWLQEFREQSRREDEIYGLDKQRVDVNVHGSVAHKHSGNVGLSFKDFVTGAMQRLGVDVEAEVIDVGRADEALVAVTERALAEGTFLEDLVEREREEQLALAGGR